MPPPHLGRQTALNTAVALAEMGVLERFDVELIGASIDAIRAGEDREEFKEIVERSGAEVARSLSLTRWKSRHAAAAELGYPLVRSSLLHDGRPRLRIRVHTRGP